MTVAVSDFAVLLPTRRVIEVQIAGERLPYRHGALGAPQWSKRLRVDKHELLARAPSGTETTVSDSGNDGSGSGSNEISLTERGLLAGCQMRMSQRLAPNWDSNLHMHTFRELAR